MLLHFHAHYLIYSIYHDCDHINLSMLSSHTSHINHYERGLSYHLHTMYANMPNYHYHHKLKTQINQYQSIVDRPNNHRFLISSINASFGTVFFTIICNIIIVHSFVCHSFIYSFISSYAILCHVMSSFHSLHHFYLFPYDQQPFIHEGVIECSSVLIIIPLLNYCYCYYCSSTAAAMYGCYQIKCTY
jgi:hypothetical protein